MVSEHVFDEVWLVGLVWLYVLLAWVWPFTCLHRGRLAPPPIPSHPTA